MAITARPAPGEPVIHLRGRHIPWLVEVHRNMFRTKPLGTFGAALVLLLVFAAIFADVIAGDPTDTELRAILQSPSAEHWFGTDMIGRDIFDRVVHGARVSIT